MMLLSLLFATGLALASAPLPDFSGYWQLDAPRSQISPNTTTMWMRVNQKESVLQVNLRAFDRSAPEENQTFIYTVDSADNRNTMHGAPMTSRVAWDNDGLRFHSEAVFGSDVLTMDDRWSLSSDGALLTFHERSQFGQEAPREALYVFMRRQAAEWPADTSSDPAEKVFRNIKILAGRPASQVPLVMGAFDTALGVSCAYCHVAPDWQREDKPPKGIAREMFGMVAGLSAGVLNERGGITCWTCHRGQSHPSRFPSAELDAELKKWPETLSGVPDQLKLTMTVYARSLGVTCDYCHVQGDWTNAAKAPMQAVPTMLQVFEELPKYSHTAANRMQCWMCHQGSAHPERAPQ